IRLTELTHPLAGTEPQAPAVTKKAKAHRTSHTPTFAELVYAHFDWWQQRQQPSANGRAGAAFREELARYERRHGEVVHAYWCSHVESAAALTEKKRSISWATPLTEFHRESDWATKNAPDIARELHRCDELAVRARIVLRGIRQRICMRLVMASAAHLLSLADARAAHTDETKVAAALEEERAALDKAEAYYCTAANGQAQIVYFVGMVFTAAVISAVTGICLAANWVGVEYAALIAGAVGAVISVVQRINAGQFDLEYDVGRPYAFFLGGLRPLIGGASALVIAFAFKSGVLNLPLNSKHSASEEQFALVVLGFISGFSERFAKDTLAAAAGTVVPEGDKAETTA
ncbi:MAG: hypothetical protein ACJ74V_06800, partial [Gaiellaceae bacterium]